MAAIAQELADSLTQDEIPIKLRCASCNRLTVNAFRLPCCDQNVCGSCQTTLPDTCPVCMHSPLSADDCKPNKSLRLTVKAFLKNEEKKRDKMRADAALVKPVAVKDEATEQADRPASAQIPNPAQVLKEDAPKIDNIVESIETEDVIQPGQQMSAEPQTTKPNDVSSLAEQDRTRDSASVEIITGDGDNGTMAQSAAPAATGDTKDRDDAEPQTQQLGHDMSNGHSDSTNGYIASNNMFTGNNNFNGVNPMMMANSMGMNGMNGMNSMNWGGFNSMMGMGMDPNMMMYGGFNGQGMGYNGMNMGMMGNGGSYGNWGGQMGGMNGNFGANAGYYPNSGYNQQSHRGGHFNHMSQRNSSHSMNNNRFGQSQRFAQNAYDRNLDVQGQAGHHQTNGGSVSQTEQVQEQVAGDEPNKSDETKTSTEQANPDTTATNVGDAEVTSNTDVVRDHDGELRGAPDVNVTPHQDEQSSATADAEVIEQSQPILSAANPNNASGEQQGVTILDTSDASNHMTGEQGVWSNINMLPAGSSPHFMSNGYNEYPARGRGGWRGRGRGRGGFGRGGYGFDVVTPLTPSEPLGTGVVGAPTGPKAMRDGAPIPGFRGRGGFAARGGRGGTFGMAASPMSTAEPASQPNETAHTNDEARDSSRRSRSETRSPTRHISHRRRRSESVDRDAKQQDDDSLDEYGRTKKRRRHSIKDNGDEQVPRDEAIVVEHVNVGHENVDAVVDHDSERAPESRHRSRHHRSSRHDKDRSRSPDRSRDHSQHRSRDHSRRHTPERSERSSRRHKHRSRSRSPRRESHERDEKDSKHRSHRDRDHDRKDRRREDKDRRSDRDRDDHGRDRDRDKDRHHRRSQRDHSAERPHSSRDETKQVRADMPPPPAPEKTVPGSLAPPTAPKGPSGVREFKIQGRSRMAASPVVPAAPPKGPSSRSNSFSSNAGAAKAPLKEQVRAERPEVDAHTLEREARNRDRMLKEAQRMSLLMNRGQAGKPTATSERTARKEKDKKRDRRRGSGKYEEEDTEARARRVEEEREAERWS